MNDTFSKNLRKLRQEKQMTQEQVAENCLRKLEK